jgi:hypothetical protein
MGPWTESHHKVSATSKWDTWYKNKQCLESSDQWWCCKMLQALLSESAWSAMGCGVTRSWSEGSGWVWCQLLVLCKNQSGLEKGLCLEWFSALSTKHMEVLPYFLLFYWHSLTFWLLDRWYSDLHGWKLELTSDVQGTGSIRHGSLEQHHIGWEMKYQSYSHYGLPLYS